MQQSEHVILAPDLQTADEACGPFKGSQLNAANFQQSVTHAGEVLDRLHLTARELFTRLTAAVNGADPKQRFYALADMAKEAYNLGNLEQAQGYATELLQLAPQYPEDWNYGNAIYYGNFVLGRVALQQGDVTHAGKYLLAAGGTKGSPQLNSFGPNVSLAKELLEKGQSAVVLDFLAECRNFWRMDRGRLDQWSTAIRAGETPDFRSNLSY
jgi:hypothetical protein